MSYQAKPTDIRKHVIYGMSTSNGPVQLYVNKHAGEMWATNKCWATMAERIAPLLQQYNLSAEHPGVFDIDRTARPSTDQAPEMTAFVRDITRYAVSGVRVQVGGELAYALDRKGVPMALFTLDDGATVGIRSDTLDWLSDLWSAPLPDGYRYDGSPRVVFKRPETGGVVAAIFADVIHVIKPHAYGTDPDTGRQVSIPAVEEPADPRLLGIIMATKYSDA
jgi:hypothetical protein